MSAVGVLVIYELKKSQPKHKSNKNRSFECTASCGKGNFLFLYMSSCIRVAPSFPDFPSPNQPTENQRALPCSDNAMFLILLFTQPDSSKRHTDTRTRCDQVWRLTGCPSPAARTSVLTGSVSVEQCCQLYVPDMKFVWYWWHSRHDLEHGGQRLGKKCITKKTFHFSFSCVLTVKVKQLSINTDSPV